MNDERQIYQGAEKMIMAARDRLYSAMDGGGLEPLKSLRQRAQIASAVLRGLGSLIDLTAPVDPGSPK